jgi:tetratricopeptide (TPR) repeat protein
MVCPRCGHATADFSDRCAACSAIFAVAAGGAIDATSSPPGGVFPSTGLTTFGAADGTGTGTSGVLSTGDLAASAGASGPLKTGQSFGPRYHILKLLGAGGMGAVYQAWDAEINVAVALKVIRADGRRGRASPEVERRLKNELLLARQVTHKHVVRIHDLGEIDGIKYITMPYVQGDDLGTVLRRHGKLPIGRALRLARQIAAGLEAAHDAGVVHRDLKPPNIMIAGSADGEQALIMDFGISSSRDEATTGTILGTLEYMSPEQGTGEAVDARSDLYAFGLILHEMVLGLRPDMPRTGPERLAAMRRRFEQGVPPLRTVDETIPEPLESLVMRCLECDPAARFQTTRELTAALAAIDDAGELIPVPARISKRVLAPALVVVLAMIGGTYFAGRRANAPVAVHPPVSVLIADFDNRANDPSFRGALENALGLGIEGASFVNAFDRGDAQKLAEQYKAGSRVDEQIARLISVREGINLIVSGSIEPQGAGYLLSAKLIDTAHLIDDPESAAATVLTAKAASKADVLRAVASLAAQVRTTLGDTTPAPQRRAEDETLTAASLDAIRSYAQAQDFANNDKDEQAVEYYRRAIEQDPNFGRAYAGLALSTEHLGRRDESAELWKKALALLERMTEREKYRTLGVYYRLVAHNNEKAIETYTALVKAYPADATGYNNLAVAHFAARNFPKALEAGRRAVELSPSRERYQTNYALYAMYSGGFAEAAAQADRIVKAHPDATFAYLPLAVAGLAGGKPDVARGAYQRMATTGTVGASFANMGLADMAIYQGRYDDAESTLKPGLAEDRRTKNTTLMATKYLALAEIYVAQGKTPLATDTIRRALALGQDNTITVPAARLFLRAGNEMEPKRIAGELLNSLQPESRAYGHLITGEIALKNARTSDAVESFRAALKLTDLWLARFSLGVAYVEAGGHDAEALAELDACVKRNGEATSIFLDDDVPSFRYLATLPYWLGRAQVGVGLSRNAADNFKRFLALRPDAARDPLAADAARRLASLAP